MYCGGNKKLMLLGVVLSMLLIGGCSLRLDISDTPLYSRADVQEMGSSVSFGYGRSDDIYVALSFIYNNELVCAEHGDSFEITAEDIVCYTSEGESFFFRGIYKGNAEYAFLIEQQSYHVVLSKTWGSTWTVDKFYLDN